jgi:3-dehydroquinate dehydratase
VNFSSRGQAEGVDVAAFQSNHEGELINQIHDARGNFDVIILNPGALTHYSYAIHDAIRSVNIPVIEVHMSNITARESWRSRSVITPAAWGQITGFRASELPSCPDCSMPSYKIISRVVVGIRHLYNKEGRINDR